MAIVAILIAVAAPLYTSHLIKGRRNQAEIALLYLASQLESFYSLQDSYQGATLEALGVNPYTDNKSYLLSIQSSSAAGYNIAASPLSQQAKSDTLCQTLLLNERGDKSVTGTGTAEACWN